MRTKIMWRVLKQSKSHLDHFYGAFLSHYGVLQSQWAYFYFTGF